MADEQLLVDLLIEDKSQSVQKAINGAKTLEGKIQMVIKAAQELSSGLGTSYQSAVTAFGEYNKAVAELRTTGAPGAEMPLISPKALEAATNFLAVETQITEEKKEQNVVQNDLDKKRVQDISRAQELAAIEDKEFTARKALAGVEEKIQALRGKSPFQQTQALVPLMSKLSKETGASTDQMLKLIQATGAIDGTTVKNVTRDLHFMKNSLFENIRAMFSLEKVMNTAFGVGMAMLIFQLQMAVTEFFANSLKYAKEFAGAMANLRVGEEILSSKGIEISGKQIMKVLDELDKKLEFISRRELAAGLGSVLNQLSGFGITAEQAKKVVEVAAVVKLKYPDKDISEIVANITNGILTGTSEATKNIGLQFDELRIKQKAKELGYIEDTTDALTEQEKVQARLAIAADFANEKLGTSIEQADKQLLMLAQADKLWQNIQLTVGQLILPALVSVTGETKGWLQVLNDALETIKQIATIDTYNLEVKKRITEEIKKQYGDFTTAEGLFVSSSGKDIPPEIQEYLRIINNPIIAKTDPAKYLEAQIKLAEELKLGKEELAGVWQEVIDTYYPTIGDTATNSEGTLGDGELPAIDQDKVQKLINDILETLDEFYDRAAKAEEDYQIKSKQEWDDYYNEVYGERTRFIEDWMNDRNKIIADAEEEMAEEIAEHNQDKLDAEAKFQEELRQLREKYLMSLDDALHERDARQILRLAREYAMNKQNMINEFNLKQQQDDIQHQLELAEIAKKRDERLAELDFEMKLRLKRMDEDFALRWKRAEEEHKLEMRRLEHERQDRLRQLRTSLEEQLKLSATASAELYRIFDKFFGAGGYINTLMKGSYENTAQYAAALLAEILKLKQAAAAIMSSTPTSFSFNENIAGYTYTPPTTGGGGGGGGIPWTYKANGGLDIARKPTGIVFGEKEPEMALTVPLSKLAAMGGSVGGMFGGRGGQEKLEIDLLLSPDLEARVVNRAVGQVENAIVTVKRNSR